MNLQSFLISSDAPLWVTLLLSALQVVHILTLLIYLLTLRKYSIQSKQPNANLNSFLQNLNSFSTTTLPNLSEALKTALINKGYLTSLSPSQDQEQTEAPTEQTEAPTLEQQIIEVITNYEKYK